MSIEQPNVEFIQVHPDAKLPVYSSDEAAGLDLSICERVEIAPGERKIVTTGLKVNIPKGYEGQVRPRSGNAANKGITVLNSPGTIDSDYTGDLKVILYNSGKETVTFMCPDRIAQLVVAPVSRATCTFVKEFFRETKRGTSGFGSTGA